VVRGIGVIRSIDDLANTIVSQSGGNPVLVKDVATVTVGEKPRLGIAGLDNDDDIVQGIVLMRRGEKSSPTITRVEQLVASINNSSVLPPGVRIERIYRLQGSDRHHHRDREHRIRGYGQASDTSGADGPGARTAHHGKQKTSKSPFGFK